jgi:hypothetical protein
VRSRILIIAAIVVGAAAHTDAQTRPARPQPRPPRPFVEHGFVTFGAGIQAASDDVTEHVLFEANAETGTLDARYPGRTGVLFDGGAGVRIHRQLGVAVMFSRASRSGAAEVSAAIPHPFFDDRDRVVTGEARDLARTETAVHAQVYYDINPRGAWRVTLFGGPSFFDVEQELVTEVQAIETFPFDTAEFGGAETERASGSGVGFHGGVDVARMFSRRFGIGALIRYAHAAIDLNGAGSATVSTDAGGLQGTAGVRVLW